MCWSCDMHPYRGATVDTNESDRDKSTRDSEDYVNALAENELSLIAEHA